MENPEKDSQEEFKDPFTLKDIPEEASQKPEQEELTDPFTSKAIPEEIELENSREELSTADLIEKIEDDKEIAEIQNENRTWEQYEEMGYAKFLGKMTQEELENLFQENQNAKDIEYVTLPEKFSGREGEINMVYQKTENYNSESPEIQKVDQERSENYIKIQKDMEKEYDSLVEVGKMRYLGILSYEEIEKYKEENKVPDKNIRDNACFKEGEIKKNLYNCYEIIDKQDK